jgi:hypothetical protein
MLYQLHPCSHLKHLQLAISILITMSCTKPIAFTHLLHHRYITVNGGNEYNNKNGVLRCISLIQVCLAPSMHAPNNGNGHSAA